LRREAARMCQAGLLTAAEADALDLEAVARFWNTGLGQRIASTPPGCVHRELEFTAGFSPGELAGLIGLETGAGVVVEGGSDSEFVVVQGVADLAVILAEEIWLVDFKTDAVERGGMAEKLRTYEPQLGLYARSLERIYNRPVTERALYFLSPGDWGEGRS
jgi:ATP-dependent helicase/nuclease subunit A